MYNLKTRRHSQNEHEMGANIIEDDHVSFVCYILHAVRSICVVRLSVRSFVPGITAVFCFVCFLCVDVVLCAQFIDQF